MRTLKLHLIRHGATDANTAGLYIGCKTDVPLSPSGLTELRLLRDEVGYPDIDCLYSSPMLRCRQTAAVLFPDTDIQTVENLREYDFGSFEGKTAEQLESDPNFLPWTSGKIGAPPGGEENSEFVKRLCVGMNQIVLDMIDREKSAAGVIMHGGAMMMLLSATAVPRRPAIEWTSDFGRGYSLLITPSLYFKSGIVEVYDLI